MGGADRLPAATALVRYAGADGPAVGVWRRGRLLAPASPAFAAGFDGLLRMPADELRAAVEAADGPDVTGRPLLAPVDGQEVWAAGVTYLRSRDARLEESGGADIYDRVYAADRPELFFKAAGWRVVADGEDITIRPDSDWNVPEPELAVLVNARGEIVAYGIGDDVSSRSIEGANPLYLPQAKIWDGSCALGPAAVPAWEVVPGEIRLTVTRDGREVFTGATHPSQMARTPADLVAWLTRSYRLPRGAWLLTGTGIVPGDDFTLRPGDEVVITIDGLGSLRNPVRTAEP